jgi:ribosome-binding ATPase YchF (GTP1/OBG family)
MWLRSRSSHACDLVTCATDTSINAILAMIRQPADAQLKEPDAKIARRLENIRDLVLYRFNGTGIQDALKRATEIVGLIPMYPVANLNNFTNNKYVVVVAAAAATT